MRVVNPEYNNIEIGSCLSLARLNVCAFIYREFEAMFRAPIVKPRIKHLFFSRNVGTLLKVPQLQRRQKERIADSVKIAVAMVIDRA